MSLLALGFLLYVPSSTVSGVVSLYVLPSSATELPPPDVRKYTPPAMTANATTAPPMIKPVFFFGASGGVP